MTHPIPDAALAQHIAILGKTGSGKTYAAKGIVERLLSDGGRVCVIDPTGAWHGLRSSATGKSAGFPVVIFGGSHADLPLAGAHGEAIAEIIGTSSTPAILDTSLMRVGERTRFFADFADALVRKNKGPLHLIIDEAHLFAPQGKVNDPQSGAMLHAANNLVSLGRSRGLRIILITQRPAKLHKDSLTQVETLVALRLIAPQDREAVKAWIKDNADQVQGENIIASLATLKTGHGWIWAPELGILEQASFPEIKTFDTSRAPEDADAGTGPVLAPIDRDAIEKRLTAVASDALANDPKTLRTEIARLQRELKSTPQADPDAIASAELRGIETGKRQALQALGKFAADLAASVGRAAAACADAKAVLSSYATFVETQAAAAPARQMPAPQRPAVSHPARSTNGAAHHQGVALSKAERRILTALAQYQESRTKNQVAILAGYAVNGGGFNNAISSLRTAGFLTGSSTGFEITESGLHALGSYEVLPTGAALLSHWMSQLTKAEREALRVLAECWPQSLTKDALASQAGYTAAGGGFNNALSRLRTLELIEGRGDIKASNDLFE